MKQYEVTNSAIRRLPVYYRHLKVMESKGIEYTSTKELSQLTGVHDTQIRKDIALTGLQGTPRKGHVVTELIEAIEDFLNWKDTNSAFLVGVGNIGSALLNYNKYEGAGLKVIAGFDNDPSKIGKEINEIRIFPLSRFSDLVKRMHIHIGIITVPGDYAQSVANLMVESGILAIWNFTPVKLKIPEDIIVENVDLYRGLGVISRRLAEKLTKKK
ncbi:MAG: redox-sensing transcriptional repressor Rex [Candidatus Cloacimonetes bacterium]|nr:redox-sensing transcriptional repressor Rex [Candidatus Cloacimonadota bacterium]